MEGKNKAAAGGMRDRFADAMFYRAWVPALVSCVGWSLSDIADAVVLGQHLGAVGLASISLILPVFMVNNMFAYGLGAGGAMQYAVLLSHGKREDARAEASAIYLTGLLLSTATAVLGLLFLHPLLRILGTVPADGALFECTKAYLRIQLITTPLFYFSNIFNYYLRNDSRNYLAGIGSVAGNLCDIVLNFVLVLGLKMGTGGAALATALGQIAAICIYLPGVLKKDHSLRFRIPAAGWLREGFSRLRTGLSVSIQYLYQLIFLLLCNNLLMRIGGEEGIAVFDVLQNTSYLILYFYEGTARAMQPIVSTFLGENNRPGLRRLYRTGFLSGMGAGTLVILFAELRPDLLCLLFGLAGSSTAPLACIAIRIYGLGAFFGGLSILLCNFLQARELESFAFWLETLRGALILIPSVLLFAMTGLKGFWWLFPVTEISSLGIVILWILVRSRSRSLFTLTLPEERIFRRTVPASRLNIGQASADLEEFCDRWQAAFAQKYTVMLAVEEVGMAILKHGFREPGSGGTGRNLVSPDISANVSADISPDISADISADISPDISADISPDISVDNSPDVRRAAGTNRKAWFRRLFPLLFRRRDGIGYIQITVIALEDGSFEIHLRDNALEFNPFSLEGGSVPDGDDLDATGILLIRKRAKKFHYRRFQGLNTLVITV